jgi:hypothetical protein
LIGEAFGGIRAMELSRHIGTLMSSMGGKGIIERFIEYVFGCRG